MSDFYDLFYTGLLEVQSRRPELFEKNVEILEDYHIARSFRRGAATRAQVAGVSSSLIDWVNRRGTGTEVLVKGPMRVTYSERKQMLDYFLEFSRVL